MILRIAEIRKEKKYFTICCFALLSNGYSRIENGHTYLTINTLHAICNYLNIELGTILDPMIHNKYSGGDKCISVKKNGNSIHILIHTKNYLINFESLGGCKKAK